MPKFSGIYQIQSRIKPERKYIGSAVNMHKRWGQHLYCLQKGKHHSKILQNHFNKYGAADLQFTILLGCPEEDLIRTEQFFLDTYPTFFNICKRAGNTAGVKASDETRKKLSITSKGNTGRRGRPLTEEHKRKISEKQMGENNSMYGKKLSESAKERIGVKSKEMWENRKLKIA